MSKNLLSPCKRIIFVGGHHTSALEVLDELFKNDPQVRIYWMGHKYAAWGDKNVSAEYKEITSGGIDFYNISAGKVYRTFNPLKILRLPFGFFQALYYVHRIKPRLVVCFGGYMAPPVALAAKLFGIPIITHEQTFHAGWANIFTSFLADRVLLTWPSSAKYFNTKKTRVIGLPLSIKTDNKDICLHFPLDKKLRTIFITGGKQGSHFINLVILEILKDLLQNYNVILQCGENSVYKDYERLSDFKENLPLHLRNRFVLRTYLFKSEYLSAVEHSSIVIGRSGAHTVYQMLYMGKPSLYIPLPNTSHNEQVQNAVTAREAGLAEIINQSECLPKVLLSKINYMLENLKRYEMNRNQKIFSHTEDAQSKFVEEINKYI